MKTLAVVIHARLESTRCPNKHLRDLGDGNTLIDIALQNISKFTNVEEKYLAVYDQELKDRTIDGIEILHIQIGKNSQMDYQKILKQIKFFLFIEMVK